jgi:hypothetical protein
MSFNYSPKIVTNGLVLCLDAANTKSYVSGSTIWTDLSRSGINGTLTNGPTFSSANGGTIVFDGTNDYINLGSPQQLQVTNVTLSAWIKTNQTTYQIIIDDLGTSPFTSWGMWLDPTGKIAWFDGSWRTSNISVNNNQITNIVCTLNSTSLKFYINGTQDINSHTVPAIIPTTDNKTIGNQPLNSYPFSGNIYHTLIYNRALSSTEIKQNYNATKGRYGL